MTSEEKGTFEVFHDCRYLGVFSELRKATVSFCLLVCLSLRSSERMEQLGFDWADFQKILFEYFSKIVEEI
jgi:hypothetical protein